MKKTLKRSLLSLLLTGLAVAVFVALAPVEEAEAGAAWTCFSSGAGSESSTCITAGGGATSASTAHTAAWAAGTTSGNCTAQVTCSDASTRSCSTSFGNKCMSIYNETTQFVKCGGTVSSCG